MEKTMLKHRIDRPRYWLLFRSVGISVVSAQECATGPVTVGLLPKLDTDPYFQVAKTGRRGGGWGDRRHRRPAGAVAGHGRRRRSSSSTTSCRRRSA